MTLQAIKDAVNARLADFFPKFRAKQETYRAKYGHYWQGIPFSTTIPDDGATVAPTLTAAPTDQYDPEVSHTEGTIDAPVKVVDTPAKPHSWTFLGANADLPATVEAQMFCDVYEAPGGIHGYRLTCRVSKTGVTYERTAQVEMGTVITTGTWGVV